MKPLIFQIIFPAVSLFFLFGCGTSQVLYQTAQVSRDYTYLEFQHDDDPFELTTEVGGEHIKVLRILGFEGHKFLIEFTQIKGDLFFNISGTGVDFKKISPYCGTIMIRDMDAMAQIEMSAHPHAAYTLRVTKL